MQNKRAAVLSVLKLRTRRGDQEIRCLSDAWAFRLRACSYKPLHFWDVEIAGLFGLTRRLVVLMGVFTVTTIVENSKLDSPHEKNVLERQKGDYICTTYCHCSHLLI